MYSRIDLRIHFSHPSFPRNAKEACYDYRESFPNLLQPIPFPLYLLWIETKDFSLHIV